MKKQFNQTFIEVTAWDQTTAFDVALRSSSTASALSVHRAAKPQTINNTKTMIQNVSSIGQVKSLKHIVALCATAAVALCGIASTQASTQINKSFEFGPGTTQHHSHMRTFYIPANANVSVAVDIDTAFSTPLVVEIHRPDATSIDNTGPDGPLIDSMIVFQGGLNAFQNVSYTSTFGCPSTWRVRVHTFDNLRPAAKVAGTIIVIFNPPAASNVTLPGGTQNVAKSSTATRKLAGIVGKGSGTVRLKAKWHTDPTDVFHFGQYFALTVRLIRPNGTIAATQTGFSQHAPSSKTPKLDFSYNLTATDLTMAGDWTVRVSNSSVANVVDFNVERGTDLNPLVPSFRSTFTPRCN